MHDAHVSALGERFWRIVTSDFDDEVSLVDARADMIVYRIWDTSTTVNVSPDQNGYSMVYAGKLYALSRPELSDTARSGAGQQTAEAPLTAPMPGTIVSIPVAEGQRVDVGAPLVVMEAMKMEHIVEATS